MMGFLGIFFIILLAFLISNNKKKINIRTVTFSFISLIIFAMFVLVVPFGVKVIQLIANGVILVLDQGQKGIGFIFGDLANTNKVGFVFAIKVLGNIIYFAALISLLYYLKIMPIIIKGLTYLVTKLLKTSQAETMSAISTIFVGPGEAQVVIKPLLHKATNSEIFTIMVSGMTAISGSVMAGYIGIGMPANYIVAATFMSIPASIFLSKLVYPQTLTTAVYDKVTDNLMKSEHNGGLIDSIAHGAITGLKIAAIIAGMLIAFISIIALINVLLLHVGNSIGFNHLSLEKILGYALAPVAYVMGVPSHDVMAAASLIGTKTITNEFVAYIEFSKQMAHLAPKTKIIITFALCGFANIGTLGIIIGSMQVLSPEKAKIYSQFAVKALIVAILANLLNGTVAGIMFDWFNNINS